MNYIKVHFQFIPSELRAVAHYNPPPSLWRIRGGKTIEELEIELNKIAKHYINEGMTDKMFLIAEKHIERLLSDWIYAGWLVVPEMI